jgi:AcrR family transcriptional regulator
MYHDLIFESAEAVFGEKGFEHATMQDIAQEAGISLKTLYASFPGKAELHGEIMQVRATAFLACVQEAMSEDGGPLERLERGVRAYMHFLFDHRDWLRIHLRGRIAWTMEPDDRAAAEVWRRGHADYADILVDGMKTGIFYEGDPVDTSVLLQSIMQAQISLAIERTKADPDSVADETMKQLRRLLCPPGTSVSAAA